MEFNDNQELSGLGMLVIGFACLVAIPAVGVILMACGFFALAGCD